MNNQLKNLKKESINKYLKGVNDNITQTSGLKGMTIEEFKDGLNLERIMMKNEEINGYLKGVNDNLVQTNFDSDRSKTREIPAMLNSMDDALEILNNNIHRLIDKLEIVYSVLPEQSTTSTVKLHCESPLGAKLADQAGSIRAAANTLNSLIDGLEL